MTDLHALSPSDLVQHMALLDGWEDRYAYLIELGRQLPPMPPELKTAGALVRGCTSQVWLVQQPSQRDDRIRFWADSDAHIVKGLIAVLSILFNGQTPETIRSVAIDPYFQQLGLSDHLTPNRRNGFYAMVEKVKTLTA